jgi:tetratricopeptide (TPR) repeat protein
MNIGSAFYSLGQFEKAAQEYKKSLEIKIQTGQCSNTHSVCYSDRKISFPSGDKKGEGDSHSGIGLAESAFGNFPKAIEHHTKHLEVAQLTGE